MPLISGQTRGLLRGITSTLLGGIETLVTNILTPLSATFSRSSLAWQLTVQQDAYPIDGLRTHPTLGVLQESVSTNELLHSTDLSQAVWTTGISTTASYGLVLDTTLVSFPDSTTGIIKQPIGRSLGSSGTLSFRVESQVDASIIIGYETSTNVNYETTHNLLAGIPKVITIPTLNVSILNVYLKSSGAADSVGIFSVSGSQLESSRFRTTFIRSGVATATRSNDIYELHYQYIPQDIRVSFTYTPCASGANLGFSRLRLFEAQDSRGNNFRLRTYGGTNYDFIPLGSTCGYFVLKSSDVEFMIPIQYTFEILSVNATQTNVKIIVNGITEYDQLHNINFDFGNLDSFLVGRAKGQTTMGYLKDFQIEDIS